MIVTYTNIPNANIPTTVTPATGAVSPVFGLLLLFDADALFEEFDPFEDEPEDDVVFGDDVGFGDEVAFGDDVGLDAV